MCLCLKGHNTLTHGWIFCVWECGVRFTVFVCTWIHRAIFLACVCNVRLCVDQQGDWLCAMHHMKLCVCVCVCVCYCASCYSVHSRYTKVRHRRLPYAHIFEFDSQISLALLERCGVICLPRRALTVYASQKTLQQFFTIQGTIVLNDSSRKMTSTSQSFWLFTWLVTWMR